MANRKDELLSGLKTYSIPLVLGVMSLGMMFVSSNQSKAIAELEEGIAAYDALEKESAATDAKLDNTYDKEKHIEVIEGRTVSAEAIGKRMIEVDNELSAFYKTNEPFPESESEVTKMLEVLEKAQIENTLLTGASEADHINTWKLNPAWKTTLETVVTYQDAPQVPVLFSMATKDGKSAGLIYAIYDTENDKLVNINKHYTTIGIQDAVDVGGM